MQSEQDKQIVQESKFIKQKDGLSKKKNMFVFNKWFNLECKDTYYILGWLSFFRKGTHFHLKTNLVNVESISFIKNTIFSNKSKLNLTIKNKIVELKFVSKEISEHCKQTDEYIRSIKSDNSFKLAFYKGILEAGAVILHNDTIIFDSKIDKIKNVLNLLNIKYSGVSNDFIIINSENSLELLSKLYKYEDKVKSSLYNFFSYIKNKYYMEATVEYTSSTKLSKTHFTDAGIDITALSLDEIVGNVFKLNTGIHVKIPVGFWGMLCPRSSIIKTGFMMANSFGVIDSSYRGELKISLKYEGTVEEGSDKIKELTPLKCAQLILIKQIIPDMIYLSKDDYFSLNNQTNRGANGHGSTDLVN
jgi:dUTP pyrophosphatase